MPNVVGPAPIWQQCCRDRAPEPVRPRGLPKGALKKIRRANAPMVFDGEPQIGCQSCFLGEQDPHGRRVEVPVGGERFDPLVDDLNEPRPRVSSEIGGVEDGPVAVADLGFHPGGNLREHVPEAMNKTSLAQRLWVDLFDAAIRAVAPSETTSSGVARPRSRRSVRKSAHASVDSPVPSWSIRRGVECRSRCRSRRGCRR